MKLEKFLGELENPGSDYRGAPFWAWNGKLEKEELRRQIRLMHQMGLGGFFMHSRVGLDTAYLTNEWFDCIQACIDEAAKLGMNAWIYDEDRWPSGAAGGLVTKNEKYRQRYLFLEVGADPAKCAWSDAVLAAFAGQIDGTSVKGLRRLPAGRKPALQNDEKLLVFTVQLAGLSDWFNGFTYLDTLSHEAVREFIRLTHQAYKKKHGKHFGKTIPGFFTDEPSHSRMLDHNNNNPGNNSIPWTAKLPEVFQKRYGYDLLDHLPELFLDPEGAGLSQPRWHYHDCVTHLFVDAFARQIGQWCQKNGIQFTGHVMHEDSLRHQTDFVGSAMRFYEHMYSPGMDLLTERMRVYATAKQVSSAAHQFGRQWRLTETYGCTGWDFPFSGHKALGDWQVALGINLRCQHLSWYTMEAEAKRDYPASIFYQSPWWNHYRKVEDYFARIHAALSRGEEVRDILLLHPVESTWTLVKYGWMQDPKVLELDADFTRLLEFLLGEHLDFDFGDEELLGRHGKVEGTTLRFGKARYQAVVVPKMLTMRSSTLKLLQKFRQAGGKVVFAAEPTRHIDAKPSEAGEAFSRSCRRVPSPGKALAEALAGARRVRIQEGRGREAAACLYLLREDAEAYYLFVCNTGYDLKKDEDRWPSGAAGGLVTKNEKYRQRYLFFGGDYPRAVERTLAYPKLTLAFLSDCQGTPFEYDADQGKAVGVSWRRDGNGTLTIETSLPALGSRLLIFPKKAAKLELPAPRQARLVKSQKLNPRKWQILLSEANNLPLDRPAYRIGTGRWQQPEEILRLDRKVREALGVPPRGGSMCQPWARVKKPNPAKTALALRYTFTVEALPSGSLFVALEQPGRWKVSLNGTALSLESECGWWCDRSLRKLPANPVLLRLGENEILLEGDYDESHPGLEILYLLGDFGTRLCGLEPVLVAPPAALQLGDWCPQGLTFYSGNVTYMSRFQADFRKGERVILKLGAYAGVGARVLVDGAEAGIVAWEPQEVELTNRLKPGHEATLSVEILGHRRNSHGPFHHTQKWPWWTGPDQYQSSGKLWQDEYQLVPCGLLAAPELRVDAFPGGTEV